MGEIERLTKERNQLREALVELVGEDDLDKLKRMSNVVHTTLTGPQHDKTSKAITALIEVRP